MPDSTFTELKQRLCRGDAEAAARLLADFGPRVLQVVRRRLGRSLRSRFDSEDFVQAVWASFFARDGGLTQFEDPDALVAYLAGMAANKVAAEGRALATSKRDPQREERPVDEDEDSADISTPSQLAVANELWTRMIDQLSSGQRAMVEMRLTGRTFEEIAERLGVNERTVRRFFKSLERRATSQ